MEGPRALVLGSAAEQRVGAVQSSFYKEVRLRVKQK